MSNLEDTLLAQIRMVGLPEPVTQYRAIPKRRFAFDFAWPDHGLLLEVQGGIWNAGKHGRGWGILKDQEKLNLATLAGFRVLQVSTNHIQSGQAIQWLRAALERQVA